ncbi:MAG: alpha/beta hydrolase, partial [Oscillospiraceae bacterium]|nr:alpha/beta hydrolase [Oscillospiraceae bacterium]
MSKQTILILHGWGCTASVYSRLTAHLGDSYEVILPELPGFGGTPEPPTPWGVSDYADYVADFLRERGITPDVVLAHSLGCRIALKLLTAQKSDKNSGVLDSVTKVIFTGAAEIKPKKTAKQKLRTRLFKL